LAEINWNDLTKGTLRSPLKPKKENGEEPTLADTIVISGPDEFVGYTFVTSSAINLFPSQN